MSLRREKKRQARDLIVNRARILFARDGFERTTMRAIADACGLSYQTIYNYFPTKVRLLHALMVADLTPPATADANRQEALTDAIEALVQRAIDALNTHDRAMWREVCAGLIQQGDASLAQALFAVEEGWHTQIEDLLRRAMGRGELSARDPGALAQVITAIVDQSLLRYLVLPDMTLNQVQRQILNMIDAVLALDTPAQEKSFSSRVSQ